MTYTHTNKTFSPYLSEAENNFQRHISRFGSKGYPVHKIGSRRWIWADFWGVKGAPVVYRTKRAAVAAVELYLEILCDRSAGRI